MNIAHMHMFFFLSFFPEVKEYVLKMCAVSAMLDESLFLDVFTEWAATRDLEKLEATPVTHIQHQILTSVSSTGLR